MLSSAQKQTGKNREETLVICSYIYPAIRSETASEKADAYKYHYSAVGKAKEERTDVYKVCVNERENRGMTAFSRKYAKRLAEKTADAVLKRSWADRVAEAVIFDRDGRVYKSRFGFRVKAAVIIGLLILLLLLRLAIPGYHPSFR